PPSLLFASSFFLLITLRPPLSTLFPYTTLFRSLNDLVTTWLHWVSGTPCFRIYGKGRLERDWRIVTVYATHRHDYDSRWPLWQGDRKSTRLNSSHEWISYAVFCLKKKRTK